MRTRVKLDTQGLLELSVSYEVEDARNPLPPRAAPSCPSCAFLRLAAPYSLLQPLTAPYSPLQPLTAPYNSSQVEEVYNPLELLLRGKGVVRVHVHGASGLKPLKDTTKVLPAAYYTAYYR